ncbi:MAG TPA: B12-binding domain-containing radical SAM protein [Cytophagales bacterium]|nr:B12-binding domain-containing radical SAM protein [Cytophagales bacterium]
MNPSILLITPPFTQLNTPYPATTYIKGFLNTQGIPSFQMDLGIEVVLDLFSSKGLNQLFDTAEQKGLQLSENSSRILTLRRDYISTIDAVMRFLQHKNPTLAYTIEDGNYLPKASRFDQVEDLDWAFGTMGIQDRARHFATLYLEDLSDFIKETIDPFFGFSRYAERLGSSASSFDPIYETLESPPTYIDNILTDLLKAKVEALRPDIVCLSVPFPGNLYGAFRCGKYLKTHHPDIKVLMGGGYPNTELRSLSEPRVFDYCDFITLDDGERPIMCLLDYFQGKREKVFLKRTFTRENGKVVYINGAKEGDFPFSKTGTPDYSDLLLDKYLSVIEIANPMHRLWSDGRWNKLTMAHGCYWKKCTFCDISLDYIKNYEPVNAALLCDRIEELVKATGETGFHFVDEAAPPALMGELALEIIRRKLSVTWWANIRFEKRFTADLCRLLKASGCIAVSGGLEVASDRLLEKMKKGVTVSQVAQVANNFTSSGVMVHAYLMYGFPTQTAQETIDSLEMVRQLFENGALQSGFWHLFAMTAHSPIGLDPAAFGVVRENPALGSFANNDLVHNDPTGCDHEMFNAGLVKALFNYMHGLGFETPLQEWFDFKTPRTTIPPNFIETAISSGSVSVDKETARVVWIGNTPKSVVYQKQKKGKTYPLMRLTFENKSNTLETVSTVEEGQWLADILPKLSPDTALKTTFSDLIKDFETKGLTGFPAFIKSEAWVAIRKEGLLLV